MSYKPNYEAWKKLLANDERAIPILKKWYREEDTTWSEDDCEEANIHNEEEWLDFMRRDLVDMLDACTNPEEGEIVANAAPGLNDLFF